MSIDLKKLRAETLTLYQECQKSGKYFSEPDIFVGCDEVCLALDCPGEDITELKKSLEHWKNHHYLSGCSHAQ